MKCGAPLRPFEAAADLAHPSGRFLHTILRGMHAPIYVKDRDGRYLMINSHGAQLLGRSVHAIIGKDDRDLFPSDAAAFYQEVDHRVMATGVSETYEVRITAKGTTYYYLNTTSPYRDDEGHVIGVIGISRDITERKLAEEALRQSEQRYRQLVDSARDVIVTETLDGILTSLNPAFERITGWPREQWLGQSFTLLLHPGDLPLAMEQFEQAIRGGPARGAVRVRCRDGQYVVLDAEAVLVSLEAEPPCLLAIARDVTAEKQAEEALQRAKQLDAVILTAREVAHRLNNDLALAMGALELIQLRVQLPADMRELAENGSIALNAAAEDIARLQQVVRVETRDTPVGPALDLDRSVQP